MLSGFRALLGLSDRISQQIEYWKEYEGEEIWIRTHSMDWSDTEGSGVSQWMYVIKGDVEDVKSFPPGFLLKDVEELVVRSDFNLMYGAGSTEPVDIVGSSEAEETLRTIDEKFVSFDSIDQLEWGYAVETAEEPFRDS